MSKPAFTHGPWRIEKKLASNEISLWSPELYVGIFTGSIKKEVDFEANARLIAAAPELFEALQEMVASIDAEYSPRVTDANFPKARAALAKVQP